MAISIYLNVQKSCKSLAHRVSHESEQCRECPDDETRFDDKRQYRQDVYESPDGCISLF